MSVSVRVTVSGTLKVDVGASVRVSVSVNVRVSASVSLSLCESLGESVVFCLMLFAQFVFGHARQDHTTMRTCLTNMLDCRALVKADVLVPNLSSYAHLHLLAL